MAKSGANVRAISTLEDLRGALGEFAAKVQPTLQSIEREIKNTVSWLQQRRDYWRAEVRRCQVAVEAASRDLHACMSKPQCSRDRDGTVTCYPPDCSAEQANLSAAMQALAQAQAELNHVEQWLQKVQTAADNYYRQARRLHLIINTNIPKAQSLLNRKVKDLKAYTNLSLPSVAALMASGEPIAPILLNAISTVVKHEIDLARNAAVREAKRQEIALVQHAGRGTRDWTARELRQLGKGKFPKMYEGHHINSVDRFPGLARNPDNIDFVKSRKISKEHVNRHQGRFTNASSGKMFNRKSLMVQWAK